MCVAVDFIASYMWKLDTEMVGFPHKQKRRIAISGRRRAILLFRGHFIDFSNPPLNGGGVGWGHSNKQISLDLSESECSAECCCCVCGGPSLQDTIERERESTLTTTTTTHSHKHTVSAQRTHVNWVCVCVKKTQWPQWVVVCIVLVGAFILMWLCVCMWCEWDFRDEDYEEAATATNPFFAFSANGHLYFCWGHTHGTILRFFYVCVCVARLTPSIDSEGEETLFFVIAEFVLRDWIDLKGAQVNNDEKSKFGTCCWLGLLHNRAPLVGLSLRDSVSISSTFFSPVATAFRSYVGSHWTNNKRCLSLFSLLTYLCIQFWFW